MRQRDDLAELEADRARAASYDHERVHKPVRLSEALAMDEEPERLVPCRVCGTEVPMAGIAVWCAKRATEHLLGRGEEGLWQGQVMLCRACHAEDTRQHEKNLAAFDAKYRDVMRTAKSEGRLGEYHRSWLMSNGCREQVDALEARFAREAEKRSARRGGRKEEL